MTEEIVDRIVRYDLYCHSCEYLDLTKNENGDMPEPCNECLTYPTNENSKKPVNYKEKEILDNKQTMNSNTKKD